MRATPDKTGYIMGLFLTACALVLSFCGNAFAEIDSLPGDFIEIVSSKYGATEEFFISAGGGAKRNPNPLEHYPVIMIPGNGRGRRDWLGANCGNAEGDTNVYAKMIKYGFNPAELWLYQYTPEGKEMMNIESLTDGLKKFIYAVSWYTGSNKVQFLAHGEGAVLAHATLKKYRLYSMVHKAVYIAAPFHGSFRYTYALALEGSPVCANLTAGSAFLKDIALPDETPFNANEGEEAGVRKIEYLCIYNRLPGGDEFFFDNPLSAALSGALNYEFNAYNHDGLRTAKKTSDIFIPFLAAGVPQYQIGTDADKDGYVSVTAGGTDCDDNDSAVYPGASEIPEDGADQDCNGADLLRIDGKDCLIPVKGR